MSAKENEPASTLTREAILAALRALSEALGKIGCYYPTNRISVKTQYLVEGLFEEGKI